MHSKDDRKRICIHLIFPLDNVKELCQMHTSVTLDRMISGMGGKFHSLQLDVSPGQDGNFILSSKIVDSFNVESRAVAEFGLAREKITKTFKIPFEILETLLLEDSLGHDFVVALYEYPNQDIIPELFFRVSMKATKIRDLKEYAKIYFSPDVDIINIWTNKEGCNTVVVHDNDIEIGGLSISNFACGYDDCPKTSSEYAKADYGRCIICRRMYCCFKCMGMDHNYMDCQASSDSFLGIQTNIAIIPHVLPYIDESEDMDIDTENSIHGGTEETTIVSRRNKITPDNERIVIQGQEIIRASKAASLFIDNLKVIPENKVMCKFTNSHSF